MKNNIFFYDTSFEDYSEFQQGHYITGKLIDYIDNTPIKNAKIIINNMPNIFTKYYITVLSNDDGTFAVLVPISKEKYFIHIIAPRAENRTIQIIPNKNHYNIKIKDLYYHDRITNGNDMQSVYKYGKHVFGNTKRFKLYLNTNIKALGGIKPKDLSSQDLFSALGRIEHGIYA